MTTTITTGDVARKITEIAAESPDFAYHSPVFGQCVYAVLTDEGAVGSCIVGQALLALGVEYNAQWEDKGAPLVLANYVHARTGHDESMYTSDWIRFVQLGQDKGIPWGEAVRIADRRYPGVAAQNAKPKAVAV